MSKETTVDLSGASITVDGTDYYVDSGELTVEESYLRDARGQPQTVQDRQMTIEVQTYQPEETPMHANHDMAELTDQSVYIIFEYRERSGDGIVMIFEDDADTLGQVIDYATTLETNDSWLLAGTFHAADPGQEHLDAGDWYLVKRHGVGISHGLVGGRDD